MKRIMMEEVNRRRSREDIIIFQIIPYNTSSYNPQPLNWKFINIFLARIISRIVHYSLVTTMVESSDRHLFNYDSTSANMA